MPACPRATDRSRAWVCTPARRRVREILRTGVGQALIGDARGLSALSTVCTGRRRPSATPADGRVGAALAQRQQDTGMNREPGSDHVTNLDTSMVALAGARALRRGWGDARVEALRARTFESAAAKSSPSAGGDHPPPFARGH